MMPRRLMSRGPMRHARSYTARHVLAAQHQALPGLRRRGPLPRCRPTTTASAPICTVCGTIHYENPLNVVGTVPVWSDQVLLCRRNIEPRYGLWTLPAGFMELGETTAEGALRETDRRGRRAHRAAGPVHAAQRRARRPGALFYRARLLDTDFAPGPETIEARLFREDEMPWDEIAFRTGAETLECFFADRRARRRLRRAHRSPSS